MGERGEGLMLGRERLTAGRSRVDADRQSRGGQIDREERHESRKVVSDSLLDTNAPATNALAPSYALPLGIYGLALTFAELAVALIDARLGLAIFSVVFATTIAAAVRSAAAGTGARSAPAARLGPGAALYAVLVVPPLLRILALAAPVASTEAIREHGLLAGPALLAVGLTVRATGYSLRSVGLRPVWRRQVRLANLALLVVGAGFGFLEYLVLRPASPTGLAEPLALAIGFAMILAASAAEELLFRGLLLHAMAEVLGGRSAVVYGALLFAVLHLAYRSPLLVAIALAMGLVLGEVTRRTGSVYGAVLSHAVAGFGLFVAFPLLLG